MNNHQIESEINAKGLTAPRVTMADIESNIVGEAFFLLRSRARRRPALSTSISRL